MYRLICDSGNQPNLHLLINYLKLRPKMMTYLILFVCNFAVVGQQAVKHVNKSTSHLPIH